MGIADRSAFPPHLDSQEEVNAAFPDDSQYGGNWFGRFWKWLNKTTKHWDAFGPRSPRGVAFTTLPILILFLYAVSMPLVVALSSSVSWSWQFLWPFCPFPMLRKWREYPVFLWGKKDGGFWRFECFGQPDLFTRDEDPRPFLKAHPGYYPSRVQLWTRKFRFVVWPLFFAATKYNDTAEVIPVGQRGNRDGQLKYNLHVGAGLDGDKIYWLWKLFVGRHFK